MRITLSRYDSGLLLGLRPVLFSGIGSMLRIRVPYAPPRRMIERSSFFVFVGCDAKARSYAPVLMCFVSG